ncbi:PilZ domain-containing protein [Pseudomonas sp. R5(2019)]|uniref:PilZ domain-containing protein n=1 Tax=Pseudomonas sp. R5(2019) TaxID=2697566 RepID=UPI0014120F95|nr:PilZ domain-containing protein [Pseudomonas sp. R5(2019)]NBA96471.1 PilZ domain-containing protein [Pseudomonas sp. R5(2019)]
MTEPQLERRRFKRIPFDAPVELVREGHRWRTTLADVSLKGLLAKCPEDWSATVHQVFDIDIQLSPEVHVHMKGEFNHETNDQLGFTCRYLDLHSSEHLRRLIELNLGDEKELLRELRQFIEL